MRSLHSSIDLIFAAQFRALWSSKLLQNKYWKSSCDKDRTVLEANSVTAISEIDLEL
jgi:hypothetical protein